jgi:hypothetical protein
MATLAVYVACLCDHDLAPGERGICLLIAPDQRQAKISLDYAAAAIESSPILKQTVVNRTADAIELRDASIEVMAASFRRLRGPTYIAVIADEAAFWYSDEFSANADTEILNAVRPGLATTSGPLIIASSPYARRGELFATYDRHFGAGGDPSILVAQGASRTFNPSLPQSVVDRALERDASSARAEFLAEFRTDIEGFVSLEIVKKCLGDHQERMPEKKHKYHAFVDPSGGSSDSFTLAIAHREAADHVVVDAIRDVAPPFSPEAVVREFCQLLKRYGLRRVTGDRYAGEFPRELFRKQNIQYAPSDKSKSELFVDLLASMNSGSVSLPRSDKLVNQLVGLERRTSRAGRDSVDHAPGGHDDLANAVAGAVDAASVPRYDSVAHSRSYVWGAAGFGDAALVGSDGDENVANPQSRPDSAVHRPPTEEVEGIKVRVIGPPRIW